MRAPAIQVFFVLLPETSTFRSLLSRTDHHVNPFTGTPYFMLIDKQQIRLRFERAAATYDRQATIQQRVATRLLTLLDEQDCTGPEQVLEIGCCTGLLTRRILAHCPQIRSMVVNDLVDSFQDRILERCASFPADIKFLPGDIEQVPLDGRFDMIISSSTFHWIHDLETLLARLRQHLAPGGCLAFAMYGPENLREIHTLTGIGLDYPDLGRLGTMVARHFRGAVLEEHLEPLTFADPMALLQHLRQTGVNALSSGPWSRARLEAFIREYRQRFSCRQGVRLTYHPMYVLARPPAPALPDRQP